MLHGIIVTVLSSKCMHPCRITFFSILISPMSFYTAGNIKLGRAKNKVIKVHQHEVVAGNSHQCRHRVCNIQNKTKIRWVVITLVLATKLLSLYFKVLKD